MLEGRGEPNRKPRVLAICPYNPAVRRIRRLLLLVVPAAAANLDRQTLKQIEAFGVTWGQQLPQNTSHHAGSRDSGALSA